MFSQSDLPYNGYTSSTFYKLKILKSTDLYIPTFYISIYIYILYTFYCERRELPSQYGRPKKRNKIFNIGRRTILYKTFSYSFSILN